jgi:hypothetical protein
MLKSDLPIKMRQDLERKKSILLNNKIVEKWLILKNLKTTNIF